MNIKIPVGLERLITENATTILTGVGVVGTAATGVLAWRGGYKMGQMMTYEKISADADAEAGIEHTGLSFKSRAKEVAPLAAPPVLLGSATIAAVVLSHRMSTQKVAALAAAYGMSQKHFEEYRDKVTEKLGITKEQKARDEIAQEKVNQTPGSDKVIIVGTGNVLCFDAPNGRYFESTVEKIRQVANHVNEQILHHDAVSANHFYGELGLPETKWGEEVGWNMDNIVDLDISTTMTEDQRPCLVMDFKRYPSANYQSRDY